MKKFLVSTALLCLAVAMAQAQVNEKKTAEPQQKESLKVQRVEKAETLKATPIQEKRTEKEQLDAAISELQKYINENADKEGFQKDAYENRLSILREKREQISER